MQQIVFFHLASNIVFRNTEEFSLLKRYGGPSLSFDVTISLYSFRPKYQRVGDSSYSN